MSEAEEYEFATDYAKTTTGEVLASVDWNLIESFEETNILDVLMTLPEQDKFREPNDKDDAPSYTLDNGSKVSFRLLKVFQESHDNLCLISALTQMERLFFTTPAMDDLADVIAAEIEEQDNQLFGYSLFNFPYHTTMLYFAVKYRHLETEVGKYREMLGAIDETLKEMKITPEVTLPLNDTPAKFFSEWGLIEIDALQLINTDSPIITNDQPPQRLM